jgi:hypothetical protein
LHNISSILKYKLKEKILNKLKEEKKTEKLVEAIDAIEAVDAIEAKIKRKIYICDVEYIVELPAEYDIYEGLRCWYPHLYEAVMYEEQQIKDTNLENKYNEDIFEQTWSYIDYVESIYD